ncbi:5-dehydro-4-deoxyglucarate dehydratase [Microlunatus elymi]|uniref:Probable 5-dehydro-4-deoxyglucarate dehydratase n=1 Tax=Microlunatus elymi TaxID=2596828 RepID=A0A516PZ16_9ACTN|nr:5-dehydro-4-deoxyglucarate dehydratase [Microlunatus elymi]QDP96392.1 5-dehydro-4-deoxyglucarate dehydratase [Microlunatus elymi]
MTDLSPVDVAGILGSGLLSFPVTHFDDRQEFDEAGYRDHIAWLSEHRPAGLFAAGGTGEFFSLTPGEVERVVSVAVGAAPDGLPIIAPSGGGTATALELVRAAERAGAHGILLFPPYLTEAGQDGLAEHVRTICAATDLGVIIYNRANAIYAADTVARLAEDCPNLIGFKDGAGNIEQLTRIYSRLGDRLLYVGGLPTAELYALPYLSLGLTTYSSAIFNFVPRFALSFYAAVRGGDHDRVFAALNDFVIPYSDLRNEGVGYAVSIIKAGMKIIGRSAGPVRPPLTDLDQDQLRRLAELINKVN